MWLTTMPRQLERLRAKLSNHMLRRIKSQVFKEMPPKVEILVPVSLTPYQRDFYRSANVVGGASGIAAATTTNILLLQAC
jgi:hypothetical protein